MHVGFLTLEYPPLPSGGIGTSLRTLGDSPNGAVSSS